MDLAAWFIFDAQIKVNLSEIDPNFNNPQSALGNEIGWKVAIPFHPFAFLWSTAPAFRDRYAV